MQLLASLRLEQGWRTCGSREHLIWPASIFITQFRVQDCVKTDLRDKQVLRQYVIRSLLYSTIEVEFQNEFQCYMRPAREYQQFMRPVIGNMSPTLV